MLGLKWLEGQGRNLSGRIADDAADRAALAARARSEALAQQQLDYSGEILGGQRTVDSLTPEVAQLLQRRARQGESPELTNAREAVRGLVGEVPEGEQQLRAVLEQMGVGGTRTPGIENSDSLLALAQALGQARTATNPSMGAMVQGGIADINSALATNKYARMGLVGGIGAGGVATIPLVTTGGQQLLALMENMTQAQQAEEQSMRGVQV